MSQEEASSSNEETVAPKIKSSKKDASGLPNPKNITLSKADIDALTPEMGLPGYWVKYNALVEASEKKPPSEFAAFKLGNFNDDKSFVKHTHVIRLVETMSPSGHHVIPEHEYERTASKQRKKSEKLKTNSNAVNAVIALISPAVEKLIEAAASSAELNRKVTITKQDVEIALRTRLPPSSERDQLLAFMNSCYDKYMASDKSPNDDEEDDDENSSSGEEETDDKKPEEEAEEITAGQPQEDD